MLNDSTYEILLLNYSTTELPASIMFEPKEHK